METTCEIQFVNNPEKVFYSGSLLRGVARLSLPHPKAVRSIYLDINGRAVARWDDYDQNYPATRTGIEIYLDRKLHIEESEGFFCK